MIRVVLPYHLRMLAGVGAEVQVEVAGPATQRLVLDALEARYPMLRGTIRDHVTQQRRPMLRFFACEADLSHEPPDAPLPDAVASGAEPFFVVGAIAGGQGPAGERPKEERFMGSATDSIPVSRTMLWAGRIVSALPVLLLLFSAVGKLVKPAQVVEGFAHLGYPEDLALGLAILEVACTVVYLIPRTSILGAVLLTGYLGGATATHVRIGEPSFVPVLLGVLVWGGLYLRDSRLRALLPWRRDQAADVPRKRGIVRVLQAVLVGVVAVVVLFVVVVALQPSAYHVVRSATISAPPAEVFAQVNDFHNWDAWSPWAKLDPACKNTFEGAPAGTGAVFKWSGNDHVGEGRMTVLESRPNELIRIKLEFVRPFESTCATEFTFKPEGDQTAVTWSMSGANNFVAKAFCLFMNMDKTIGGDFEKGLAQMKALTEAAAKK